MERSTSSLKLCIWSKELVAATQEVTHLTEQLMAFLYKVQIYEIHTQAALVLLVQTHCLLLTQVGKSMLEALRTTAKDLGLEISANLGPPKDKDICSADPAIHEAGVKFLCNILDLRFGAGFEILPCLRTELVNLRRFGIL